MISTERRTERYKVFYLWKMLTGLVPNIGVEVATEESTRTGLTVKIPPKSGSKESVQTLKDQFFMTHAPRLFNSLPKCIRDRKLSMDSFKSLVDSFLMTVPDCPVLAGYPLNNPGVNGRNSNSVVDWIRNNPALQDWIPEKESMEEISDW